MSFKWLSNKQCEQLKKKLNEMLHVLALCVNGQIIRKWELLVTNSCYLELDQGFSN